MYAFLALAALSSLSGRSIADNCTFLYRIETDFELTTDEPGATGAVVWLRDLYTEQLREPEVVELGRFTQVSMSQNPRYLAHELYFALQKEGEDPPATPTHKANFSGLMRRCHDYTQRESVPYEPLDPVLAN